MAFSFKSILLILGALALVFGIVYLIIKHYPRKSMAVYLGRRKSVSGGSAGKVYLNLNTGEIARHGAYDPTTNYFEEYKLPNGKRKVYKTYCENDLGFKREYGYLTYDLSGRYSFNRDDSIEEAFDAEEKRKSAQKNKFESIKHWLGFSPHILLPLLCILLCLIFPSGTIGDVSLGFSFLLCILHSAFTVWGSFDGKPSKESILFCWIGLAVTVLLGIVGYYIGAVSIPKIENAYMLDLLMASILGIKTLLVSIIAIAKWIAEWIKEKLWNR